MPLTTSKPSMFSRALVMAVKAHDGQRRASGEPYIVHPVGVAGRLDELWRWYMPAQYVRGHRMAFAIEEAKAVAALHDVLEDTDVPAWRIEAEFGAGVRSYVELLSRPPKDQRTLSYQEWIESLVSTGNQLVMAVKLADILDNLSTVDDVPSKASLRGRYEKARDTLVDALDPA